MTFRIISREGCFYVKATALQAGNRRFSIPHPMPIESIEVGLNPSPTTSSHLQVSTPKISPRPSVTARAYLLGLGLSISLAALNAWVETVANVHFLGGVQMLFGAIFALLALVIMLNGALRLAGNVTVLGRLFPPLSSAELIISYVIMSSALFSTRENDGSELFYSHIPKHFVLGWGLFPLLVYSSLFWTSLRYYTISGLRTRVRLQVRPISEVTAPFGLARS